MTTSTELASPNPLEIHRRRWDVVPVGFERKKTADLQALSDQELMAYWEAAKKFATTGKHYNDRGWYHELYKDVFKSKKVLEIGSGFGIDAMTFAPICKSYTCLDIVPSNLAVLKRLAGIKKITNCNFFFMEKIEDLKGLDRDFDVVFAQGSLHHAPFETVRQEVKILAQHLVVGGRWIQLAYPKGRWIKNGRPPFSKWGKFTDGEETPWVEWYDWPKLRALLSPAKFDLLMTFEYWKGEFVWFDLLRRG